MAERSWLVDQYAKVSAEVARWPQWMRDMLEREQGECEAMCLKAEYYDLERELQSVWATKAGYLTPERRAAIKANLDTIYKRMNDIKAALDELAKVEG